MKEKQIHWGWILGISAVFFGVGVSIGHSLSSPEENQEAQTQRLPEDPFTEPTVFLNEFFQRFYTYEVAGSNYQSVEPYFTKDYAIEQKRIMKNYKEHMNHAGWGDCHFLSSKNYLYQTDSTHFEGIAEVRYQVKLMDQEGKNTQPHPSSVRVRVTFERVKGKPAFAVSKIEKISEENT